MSVYCRCFPSCVTIPYWKYHTQVLFDGALPVFVAVTISGATTAFIHAFVNEINNEDETLIIALNFLYSLFLGYFLGVFVMVNQLNFIPILVPYTDYIHRVAIENASFAWWSTVSLIILKRIYNGNHHYGEAFAAWLITLIIILVIIYSTNFLRYLLNRTHKLADKNIEDNLVEFDSESFSLAVAFGLTIIIAAAIISNESTNYLSGIDDISSTNDDGRNPSNYKLDVPYICYVVGITVVIGGIEYYNMPVMSTVRKSLLVVTRSSITDQVPYVNNPMVEGSLNPMDGITNRDSLTDASSGSNRISKTWIDKIDDFIFGWDQDALTKRTFTQLFTAFRAYLIGCAWYSWSILSFQNYFKFLSSGALIGLLLYAFLVTYVVLWMISRWTSVPSEIKNKNSDPSIGTDEDKSTQYQAISDEKSGRNEEYKSEILIMSGRLVVGWAWQQFVTSAVGSCVPEQTQNRLWLTAMAKCIISFFITIIGGYVDVNCRSSSRQERDAPSERNDRNPSLEKTSSNQAKVNNQIAEVDDHESNALERKSAADGNNIRLPLLA